MRAMKFKRIVAFVSIAAAAAIGTAGNGLAQGFKVIHNCSLVDDFPSTLIQAPLPDGHFYGSSQGGGTGFGSVFKMDASGAVVTIHSFGGPPGDGAGPQAALLLDGGVLYGTTYVGGASTFGTLFRMGTDGSGYSFHSMANDVNGAAPWASFFKANDGNFYLPMSIDGPTGMDTGAGTIDRVDTSLTPTELGSFSFFGDQNSPWGHLVQGSDNKLYGIALSSYAPTGYLGGVYRIGLAGGSIEEVHNFGGVDGINPQSPLLLASDGKFYGTTYELEDAQDNELMTGTIFRVAEDGTFEQLHVFNVTDGRHPVGGLIQASDGYLYGATSQGGIAELGVIYRLDLSGNYTVLAGVGDVGVGANPLNEFVEGLDGKLYGTTYQGGTNALGTIYTIDLTQKIDAITPNSGTSAGGTPVTISGAGFVAGASVTIEGANATGVGVPDGAHVTATTPANTPGTIGHVRVILPDTTVIILNNGWMSDFLDVPMGDIFHDYVRKLLSNGITAGCGGGNYCRNSAVTRAQMAVFLLKSEHGSSYVPPHCVGIFFDVPCTPGVGFPDWIEELANEGITGGCGGGNYCPSNPVTRQQMAVFLLKTEHGSAYVPPGCLGIFGDVACPSLFADWIEQLYAENVTGGCQVSPLLYCPANSVLRGQMAAFLTKTFNLP